MKFIKVVYFLEINLIGIFLVFILSFVVVYLYDDICMVCYIKKWKIFFIFIYIYSGLRNFWEKGDLERNYNYLYVGLWEIFWK